MTAAVPACLRSRVGEAVTALRTLSIGGELRARFGGRADGQPLPGPLLRVATAGTADLDWFLTGGRLGYETLRDTLAELGTDIAQLKAVLDFGCGCGRVLRHWPERGSPALHGCDVNRRAVAWIRRRLPAVEAARTGATPPLPWPDRRFDLVWAFSVFTHIPGGLQRTWRQELRRVTRRGGLILVSVHGSACREQLDADELERFDRGELVERWAPRPGSNAYGVYHPVAAIERILAPDLELVAVRTRGARGNPPQDLVVLRRPH